jgi:hypothetical protein
LASPDVIRSWSHGEVTKPETINYLSVKPEKDGLFCEDLRPGQGLGVQLRQVQAHSYRGVICDRCGVEVTQAKVRRSGSVTSAGRAGVASGSSRVCRRVSVTYRHEHPRPRAHLYYESFVVIVRQDRLQEEGDHLRGPVQRGDGGTAGLGLKAKMGAGDPRHAVRAGPRGLQADARPRPRSRRRFSARRRRSSACVSSRRSVTAAIVPSG